MTPGRWRVGRLLNVTVAVSFAAMAAVLLLIVHTGLRRDALNEAENKARIILDRNLATHSYFSHRLKPAVFPLSDKAAPEGYFDPAWMSSTYAVREIDKLFRALNTMDYYYKECAINARSPENEADPYERGFIERLNRDPSLQVQRAVRLLEDRPYFTVLQRGETMERSCLRCHDTPELAPGGLVERYGGVRSFHREENEVVSAISIRIPLASAYAEADRTVRLITLTLGGGLLGVLGLLFLLNRKLVFGPLARVRAKANEISTDERHLGEEIALPAGRELADLSVSFNRMSSALRAERDTLEHRVEARTAELREANRDLSRALADIKTLSGLIPICASCKKIRDDRGYWQQVESYIASRSDAQFTHGICPECLPVFYPGYSPKKPPGESG